MIEVSPQPEAVGQPDDATFAIAAIDQEILLLLSRRFALARATGAGAWGDGDERQAALSKIRKKAFELGIPVSLVVDLWERLSDAVQAVNQQARKQ